MGNKKESRELTPIVWTIAHPDLGGSLDVVAQSAYEKLQRVLDTTEDQFNEVRDELKKLYHDRQMLEARLTEACKQIVGLTEAARLGFSFTPIDQKDEIDLQKRIDQARDFLDKGKE